MGGEGRGEGGHRRRQHQRRPDTLRNFFFSSRRRNTRCGRDWSSDVCSSDLVVNVLAEAIAKHRVHPYATFVTLDGAITGETFVRTPAGQDTRLDQIRRDSARLERELAGVRRGQRESRQRLAEIGSHAEAIRVQVEENDMKITSGADELARIA